MLFKHRGKDRGKGGCGKFLKFERGFGLVLLAFIVPYCGRAARKNSFPPDGENKDQIPFLQLKYRFRKRRRARKSLQQLLRRHKTSCEHTPRACFRSVLCWGVETPGLGMREGRAFFVALVQCRDKYDNPKTGEPHGHAQRRTE